MLADSMKVAKAQASIKYSGQWAVNVLEAEVFMGDANQITQTGLNIPEESGNNGPCEVDMASNAYVKRNHSRCADQHQ